MLSRRYYGDYYCVGARMVEKIEFILFFSRPNNDRAGLATTYGPKWLVVFAIKNCEQFKIFLAPPPVHSFVRFLWCFFGVPFFVLLPKVLHGQRNWVQILIEL